jgi:hypothetical protein
MIWAIVPHTTVVNNGLFSSTLGQVFAGVIVLILGGIGTVLIRSITGFAKKMDTTVEKVEEVHDSIAGRPPTDLVPNPAPGLIAVASGHTQAILETAQAVKTMADHQVAQNGKVSKIEHILVTLVDEGIATKSALDEQTQVTKDALDEAAEKLATQAKNSQLSVLNAVASLDTTHE